MLAHNCYVAVAGRFDRTCFWLALIDACCIAYEVRNLCRTPFHVVCFEHVVLLVWVQTDLLLLSLPANCVDIVWLTALVCTVYISLCMSSFLSAPLRVCSATRNWQPPEWAILSHIDCFSQCEIMGLKIISDCLHPCDSRATGQSLPIFFMGVQSGSS